MELFYSIKAQQKQIIIIHTDVDAFNLELEIASAQESLSA